MNFVFFFCSFNSFESVQDFFEDEVEVEGGKEQVSKAKEKKEKKTKKQHSSLFSPLFIDCISREKLRASLSRALSSASSSPLLSGRTRERI